MIASGQGRPESDPRLKACPGLAIESVDDQRPMQCQDIADRLSHLPTLPPVALRLGRLLGDGLADARRIAEVMGQDQSLTTRVLALVNSAYYSVPGGVSTLPRAVAYLGANTIYQVVLTLSVFSALRPARNGTFDLAELWTHALGVANASQAIARRSGAMDPGDAFTAGLLHDVGKVALAAACPETFDAVVAKAFDEGVTFIEAEQRLDVAPHPKIGVMLAERWRLPAVVVAGIEAHHNPTVARENEAAAASVVALADQICRWRGVGNGGDPVVPLPDEPFARAFGLDSEALAAIAGKTEEQARKTAASLGVA